MSKQRFPSTQLMPALRLHAVCIMAVLALAFAAMDASAACNAIQPPPELYVGDTASDAACTQNDIQSAIDAATCAYGTNIYITHEQTCASQHLNISGKNVTLIGRVNGDVCGPASQVICNPTCPPLPTAPRASISGHNGDAVLTISGTSTVGLKYMDITGGTQASGFSGGGIAFVGSGSLTLDTSWVRGNHATNGGSGGGLRADGKANVPIDDDQIWFYNNHADSGSGGGLVVVGPAYAHIGSPGYQIASYIGVMYQNRALDGGGIAIVAGSQGSAGADIFAADPNHPVRIEQNRAYSKGGGIYLEPYSALGDSARPGISVGGVQIDESAAQERSAVYLDVDGSGSNM